MRTIHDEWEARVENETVWKRPRKTEKNLASLNEDAREIAAFLCNTVAPILRESGRESGKDEYIRDDNVESNPPRLTLDYSTTSTCEGQLKESVLEEGGSIVVAVVAHGEGGVGKTCALRGLADDEDIQERFPGGTLFLQLGADADISTIIQGIATIVKRTGGSSLAVRLQGSKTIQAAVDDASTWFRPHTCLFLIDDIWWVNGIDSNVFYALGTMVNKRSRVVYTTRDKRFLGSCHIEITFSEKETHGELARRMLLTHAGFDWEVNLSERNEAAVEGIIYLYLILLEVCQGLPLALGVAGERIREKKRARQDPIENIWSDLYDRIKSTVCHGQAERYGGVERILDTSLKILASGEENGMFERLFRSLCVLEEQKKVPIEMLRKLWDLEDLKDTADVVDKLDQVSVLRKVVTDGGKVFVRLHDFILDIAKRKASEKHEEKNTFRRLVDNYTTEEMRRRGVDVESAVGTSSETVVPQQDHRRKNRFGLGRLFQKAGRGKMSETAERSDQARKERAERAIETVRPMCDWWSCEDDGYIHANICRILRDAGHEKQLLSLLAKPQWIVSRLQNGGIDEVERDLEIGKRVAGSNRGGNEKVVKHMEMVGKAARLSCTYVNNNKREAWFQLHGRLLWYEKQCDGTKRFLKDMEECAPKPWAKASIGFLEQAGSSASDIIEVDGKACSVQMDKEKVAFCCVRGRTIRITKYVFANGVTETQMQQCEYELREKYYWTYSKRVMLSKDFRVVVIGLPDGGVWIWDTVTGQTIQSSDSHNDTVRCVDISADGSLIVSGSVDRTVRVWKAGSGEPVGEPLVGHEDEVTCVAMSANGDRVVSGSDDKTVRVWEVRTGKPVCPPFVGHKDGVRCIAVSANGDRVVSGSYDNSVRVWDVGSGKAVGEPLDGHMGWVRCVAMSANGERVVSGSEDKTVRVWEVGGEEPMREPLIGHRDWITCVALRSHEKGVRIVSGSDDRTVRVWQVGNGELVGPALVDDTGLVVTCVAESANGERVVSGSYDGTVQVWNVGSGELMGPPLNHEGGLMRVSVNEDGSQVVSYDSETVGRIWNVAGGECVMRSRDAGWEAALRVLQQPGGWSHAQSNSWYPGSRTVTLVQADGNEVVLGTCDNSAVGRFGESCFSRRKFAHCKVVLPTV